MRCHCCDFSPATDSLFHNSTTESLEPRTIRDTKAGPICSVCDGVADDAVAEMEQADYDKGKEISHEIVDHRFDRLE